VSDVGKPDPGIETQKSPPPLPDRLLELKPLVYVGTSAWFVAVCVLLAGRYVFDVFPPIWLWTALVGTLLGFVGFLVMAWQRRASRRGSRGAQKIQ
jgi:uncharacterized protein DUF2530